MTFGRAINPYYVLIMFGTRRGKKKSNLGLKLTVPGIIFKKAQKGFQEAQGQNLVFYSFPTPPPTMRMKIASHFLVETQQFNLLVSTGIEMGVWTSLVAKQKKALSHVIPQPQ